MTATGVPIFRAWRNALNGRKARGRRKERRERAAERALLPPDVSERLRRARVRRDKPLGEVATETDRKLRRLLAEDAERRRKIWREYDDERDAAIRTKEKAA